MVINVSIMKLLYKFFLKNRYLWGLLFICPVLNLCLSESMPALFFVLIFMAIALTSIISSTYPLNVYRRCFQNWQSFFIFMVLFYLSCIGMDFMQHLPLNIDRLVVMLLISSFFGFVFVTGNFLWHKDKSLQLFAWTSIVYLWGIVITWRIHGNMIHHWMTNSDKLWWFNPLTIIVFWILFFCIISFIKHSYCMIRNELFLS